MNNYLNELQRSQEKLEQSLQCYDTLRYLADKKFSAVIQYMFFLSDVIGIHIQVNTEDVPALRVILSRKGRLTRCKIEGSGLACHDDNKREGILFKADFFPSEAYDSLSFPLKIEVYRLNAKGIRGLLFEKEEEEND